MAQLVAHLHGMQGVRGSSPLRSTNQIPRFGGGFAFKGHLICLYRAFLGLAAEDLGVGNRYALDPAGESGLDGDFGLSAGEVIGEQADQSLVGGAIHCSFL